MLVSCCVRKPNFHPWFSELVILCTLRCGKNDIPVRTLKWLPRLIFAGGMSRPGKMVRLLRHVIRHVSRPSELAFPLGLSLTDFILFIHRSLGNFIRFSALDFGDLNASTIAFIEV